MPVPDAEEWVAAPLPCSLKRRQEVPENVPEKLQSVQEKRAARSGCIPRGLQHEPHAKPARKGVRHLKYKPASMPWPCGQ